MNKKIVLTCTTYFRQEFSIFNFIENFSSLFKYEHALTSAKVIIVNEYSYENAKNLAQNSSLIKNEFPQAVFIQKNSSESGQAHSLNLILNAIKEYDYQIQWEEGWVCTAPFLKAAQLLMETTSITQVGITEDWKSTPEIQPAQPIASSSEYYCRIAPHSSLYDLREYLPKLNNYRYISELLNKVDINLWPLYSLRPGVNKVSFLQGLPMFPIYPSLWPIRFEYIYGLSWLLAGGEKAMLASPAVYRSHNKKSTYKSLNF